MANRKHKRSGRSDDDGGPVGVPEATTAREQASRRPGESDTGKLTKKRSRPQITLKNGAPVDARRAVAIIEELQITLQGHPEEFNSLLALAENRPQDADPRHFEALWARAFLNDDHSIRTMVRDLLLNSYHVTPEGAVIVPLRLKDAKDLPAAQRAQREMDRQLRSIFRKPKNDEGPSRD